MQEVEEPPEVRMVVQDLVRAHRMIGEDTRDVEFAGFELDHAPRIRVVHPDSQRPELRRSWLAGVVRCKGCLLLLGIQNQLVGRRHGGGALHDLGRLDRHSHEVPCALRATGGEQAETGEQLPHGVCSTTALSAYRPAGSVTRAR
ncbi:MAG: hypothetical protein ACRDGN_01230 [bacterium]